MFVSWNGLFWYLLQKWWENRFSLCHLYILTDHKLEVLWPSSVSVSTRTAQFSVNWEYGPSAGISGAGPLTGMGGTWLSAEPAVGKWAGCCLLSSFG